jgi:hypothetical protein
MFGRSQWTAAGAVVAMLVGGGSLLTASAAGSPSASSFVPITPCRLFDTRAGSDNIGPRATPLGPDEIHIAQVWGANGNCTIPTGATGVSLGVTVVNPTAASYLTVFPADATRPLASNLNWVAGQAPTPNAVTAPLSADGRMGLYNLAGTVDVLVDIVGFYELGSGGTPGPPGEDGEDGDPGPRPAHVVWVAASGGDFTSLGEALASITDNSFSNRYVIKIAPGVYPETQAVELKDYVDIEGSGQDVTTITCACGSNALDGTSPTLRVVGKPHLRTEVRDLTVTNTGGGTTASVGTFLGGVSQGRPSLRNVTSTATGGTETNVGILIANSDPILTDVTAVASGATIENRGLFMSNSGLSSAPIITNVTALASGSAVINVGLWNSGFDATLRNVTATATGAPSGHGVSSSSSSMTMIGGSATATGTTASTSGIFISGNGFPSFNTVTATATGSSSARGIHIQGTATATVVNSTVFGSGTGIGNSQNAKLTVRDSFVNGSSNSIRNDGSTVQVANTALTSAVQGTMACINAYNATSFVLLNATCQ